MLAVGIGFHVSEGTKVESSRIKGCSDVSIPSLASRPSDICPSSKGPIELSIRKLAKRVSPPAGWNQHIRCPAELQHLPSLLLLQNC